jgi:hypothetical protein
VHARARSNIALLAAHGRLKAAVSVEVAAGDLWPLLGRGRCVFGSCRHHACVVAEGSFVFFVSCSKLISSCSCTRLAFACTCTAHDPAQKWCVNACVLLQRARASTKGPVGAFFKCISKGLTSSAINIRRCFGVLTGRGAEEAAENSLGLFIGLERGLGAVLRHAQSLHATSGSGEHKDLQHVLALSEVRAKSAVRQGCSPAGQAEYHVSEHQASRRARLPCTNLVQVCRQSGQQREIQQSLLSLSSLCRCLEWRW